MRSSRITAFGAPAAVFLVALGARALTAASIRFAVPEGSAYYVSAAGNLATGRGLVVDVLWSYATPPLSLPRPAFDLWQPLGALLAAPAMVALGPTLAAAQTISVLVGALAAPLAWAVAREAGAGLRLPAARVASLALGAGLLVALTPLLVVQAAEPDSSAPFAVLAVAACWMMPRAFAQDRSSMLWRIGLGALIGLTYVARQEAIYVALIYLALAWRARGRDGLVQALPTLGTAFLVVAPWLLRQAMTWQASPFGQLLENAWSVQGTNIFAWSERPSLASHLALGASGLVGLRVEAVVAAFVLLLVAAFPAALIGFAGILGRPAYVSTRVLRPLALVALLTFASDALVFPVASRTGLWAHGSGPAIVWLAVVAALAIDGAIAALAARRRWRPAAGPLGRRALLGPLVLVLLALPFTSLAATLEGARANQTEARYVALAAAASQWNVAVGPLITDHPMWLNAALGRAALALPRESPASVVDLARHYGAAGVVASDPDATAALAALAGYTEGGIACFHELPAPAPFVALAFSCRTQLASVGGAAEVTPYTGRRAKSL